MGRDPGQVSGPTGRFRKMFHDIPSINVIDRFCRNDLRAHSLIKKIFTEGNHALSKGKIKGVMKTKKWWIFSFITSSGYFQKEQMEVDIERIRDLYYNNGYINVVIGEPKIQLTENKKGMIITIAISEGELGIGFFHPEFVSRTMHAPSSSM